MSKINISICIPTFNRADLLDQTLQSVASQTIKPYEVIVTDNNSTDKTDDVGHLYEKKYGFKYVKNKENLGMIGNWNKAIDLATGNYICLLHSDDLIAPYWHETWIDTIKKHQADFYTSAIVIINDKNTPLFTAHIFNNDTSLKQPKVMNYFLKQLAPMIAPSGASIYTRKIFKEIGLYNPDNKTEADVPHFFELASKYNVFYRDKIVFAWRTHAAQTFDKEKQKKTVDAELGRLDNYFNLVAKFYKKEYKNRDRLFIQTHAFMTLAAINLHLIKLKFKKVFGSYRIAKKYFPDLFLHPEDWLLFIKIQFLLARRALFRGSISKDDAAEVEWLKKITIHSF